MISPGGAGVDLGTYEATTREAALDAMAREAGYADHAAACRESGDDVAHLVVRERDLAAEVQAAYPRALACLVADGMGVAWVALEDDELVVYYQSGPVHRVPADALAALAAALADENDGNAYSRWCADPTVDTTDVERVPAAAVRVTR